MKVLLVTNYGDFHLASKYYSEGIYPSNHLWGKIELEKNYSYQVDVLPDLKQSKTIRRIGNYFNIAFLDRQLQMCFYAHKYDVIYSPFLNLIVVINFFKLIRFINVPVVSICHSKLTRDKSSTIKKLKGFLGSLKYVAIERVLFLGEKLYEESLAYGLKPDNIGWINWGIDLNYYAKIRQESKLSEFADTYVSTGKTFRDFKVIVSAFSNLPAKLAMFLPDNTLSLTPNIRPLDIPVSFNSVYEMAKIIWAGKGLLIPLTNVNSFYGLTSLLEAFALGIPTISTKNEYFYVDIEKEKVGFWVDYGDKDGWINVINKLDNDPSLVEELSTNALALSADYSMEKFSSILMSEFERVKKR